MDNVQQSTKPYFLITIDTEGDDLWSSPREITTRNAEYLPRFQSLCESYGLKPTYLTSYEMATDPFFQEFGKEVFNRSAGEIGMHLHAWNTPPMIALTEDDFKYRPYLIEYPENVMRDKIVTMTDLLEDVFGEKMVSHRAGRWSFNEIYARILVELEYRVDCSVTPHYSWKHTPGAPDCEGGTDYTDFPETCYFISLDDICLPGESMLLEVPMTVIQRDRPLIGPLKGKFNRDSLPSRALNRLFPTNMWFVPDGKNSDDLQSIMDECLRLNRDYIEFFLHSSELMPGGSPRHRQKDDIEKLYDSLEQLFDMAKDHFQGGTLEMFHHYWVSKYTDDNNLQCK